MYKHDCLAFQQDNYLLALNLVFFGWPIMNVTLVIMAKIHAAFL